MRSRPSQERKRRGRRRLRTPRRRAAWDPLRLGAEERSDRGEDLLDLDASLNAYNEAERCADCACQRNETGDRTALCEPHMARAIGL